MCVCVWGILEENFWILKVHFQFLRNVFFYSSLPFFVWFFSFVFNFSAIVFYHMACNQLFKSPYFPFFVFKSNTLFNNQIEHSSIILHPTNQQFYFRSNKVCGFDLRLGWNSAKKLSKYFSYVLFSLLKDPFNTIPTLCKFFQSAKCS